MCHAQDRSTAIQWPPVVCHACISRTALNSHSLPRIAVTGGGEGTLEKMTLTADTLQIVHTNGRADAIPNGHVGKKLEAVHVIDLSLQHSGPYFTAYTQHSGPYLTAYTQHSGPYLTTYTQHSGPYFTVHTALRSILHCIHSTPVHTSLHTHSTPVHTSLHTHSTLVHTSLYTQHSGPYFTAYTAL